MLVEIVVVDNLLPHEIDHEVCAHELLFLYEAQNVRQRHIRLFESPFTAVLDGFLVIVDELRVGLDALLWGFWLADRTK